MATAGPNELASPPEVEFANPGYDSTINPSFKTRFWGVLFLVYLQYKLQV